MPEDPRSVLTRTAPGPDLVLRYGDGEDHLVDVFLPPGEPEPRDVVVLLHGGFWRQEFDRTHVRPLAHALRAEQYVVACPEYGRSSPGNPGWPRTFDDIRSVRQRLPGLLRDAAPGRTRHRPYTIAGHSAGGHLALWWAVTAPVGTATDGTAAAEEHPERVVALAPVADLARGHAEDLDDGAVGALLGGGPDEQPERYAAADVAPMLAGYAGPADLVVLHGALDDRVPADHTRDLAGVRRRELSDVEHFGLIDPLSPAWAHLLAELRGEAFAPDPH